MLAAGKTTFLLTCGSAFNGNRLFSRWRLKLTVYLSIFCSSSDLFSSANLQNSREVNFGISSRLPRFSYLHVSPTNFTKRTQ